MGIGVAAQHPLANCRPIGDRIVVRIARPARTTPGGLALPDSQIREDKPQKGVVTAVGPGRRLPTESRDAVGEPYRHELDVAVGDTVLFAPYAGHSPEFKRQYEDDYVILREEDVLVVLPNDREEA